MKSILKRIAKHFIYNTNYGKKMLYGYKLYNSYKRVENISFLGFAREFFGLLYIQPLQANKGSQIRALLNKVDLCPVDSSSFYYSIDCFKKPQNNSPIFDNYTVDYTGIVDSSFAEMRQKFGADDGAFGKSLFELIEGMREE